MIKYNDRLSFKKNSGIGYGWELHEIRDGINPRTQEVVQTTNIAYYGNLIQVCKAIMNREAGQCGSIEELFGTIESSVKRLEDVISGSDLK